MENIKLIICDLDGTLIVKHNRLSDRNKQAIIEAKKRGIYFGIASGRPLDELNLYSRWGIDEDFDIIIGLNGCQLKDNVFDVVEDYFIMKKEWIKQAFDVMRPFKFNPVMYVGDKMLCNEITEIVKMSAANNNKEIIIAKDEAEFYSKDNYKIMFRVLAEDMLKIEKYIEKQNLINIRAFKTQDTLIEFSSSDVDKATTIEKFCKYHDIEVKDVLAFGDTTNDNGMLKWAGVGVCMKNGSDDTKMIADYICEDVKDDGVALFVEENVFKKSLV